MNSSLVKGIAIGVVVATTGGAIAGYRTFVAPAVPTHAQVLNVVAVTETVTKPREVCETIEVTRQKPVRDEHQIIGTVAGAVLGGVIGNQVGGGNGKKIATLAGAAAGGYAGNKVQERTQAGNTYVTSEEQCKTVTDSTEKLLGYDVTYRIGEETGQVRMDSDPGEQIPLVDGQLMHRADQLAGTH